MCFSLTNLQDVFYDLPHIADKERITWKKNKVTLMGTQSLETKRSEMKANYDQISESMLVTIFSYCCWLPKMPEIGQELNMTSSYCNK